MRAARTWWLALLGVALLTPVALAAVVGAGEPATLWSTLAAVTGAQAAAALVVAVVFASRIRSITHTFGIDGATALHRLLGGAAAGFGALHLLVVLVDDPSNAWLVDATGAPSRGVAGTAALVVLVALVLTSRRRQRRYEWWRWFHRIAAAVAVVLVGWHVVGLDQLVWAPGWGTFFSVLALAVAGLLVRRWRRSGSRELHVVVDVRAETPTVSTVTLRPVHGPPRPFEPGQFAWLRLAARPWAEDHPFTISSGADGGPWQVTFRHTGDWTSGPLAELRPGRHVWVDGPHGAMTLHAAADAPGIVMIAAGVGLTPIMSILRTLAWKHDERPMRLLVPPGEPLFARELAVLAARLDLRVLPVVTRPVTAASIAAALPPCPDRGALAYYCSGPPALVADAVTALDELHVPADRVLTERFEMS